MFEFLGICLIKFQENPSISLALTAFSHPKLEHNTKVSIAVKCCLPMYYYGLLYLLWKKNSPFYEKNWDNCDMIA